MTNDPFQVGVVQEINRFTNAQRGHELIDRYAVRGTEGNYTSVWRPDAYLCKGSRSASDTANDHLGKSMRRCRAA